MDAISFCTPCLKWKFILAYKDHVGFNGFTFPFQNKYLRAHSRLSGTSYDNLGRPIPLHATECDLARDRFTNELTITGEPSIRFLFFEAYIRNQVTGPNWFVSDDYFRFTNGSPAPNTTVLTYETWLTEPYPLAQLDADMDARIAAVNPDDIPWFKLKTVGRFVVDSGRTVPAEFSAAGPEPEIYLPPELQYTGTADGPVFLQEALWNVPSLRAAAWYLYVPNLWAGLGGIGQPPVTPPPVDGGNYDEPGWYIKLVGFFNMAGKYCEKTQYLDFARQPYGPQTCVTGNGVCGNYFKITPPPLDVGRNAYKLLIANCKCD